MQPRKAPMSHEKVIKLPIKSELIRGYIYVMHIFEKRFVQ